ncbi:hypothetical protein COMA2_110149 [Candidatus Nitrospira nitrificans]|uniref:Uncharacterized protein n=1 Tax=Candidatus Nitrospira nitrificans TaxID=1742973 RepID=A0A0S4LAT4_9BACT|nr:hypothetical protein COMA2_110149 [Candidatus Nitrospira nitrificans]
MPHPHRLKQLLVLDVLSTSSERLFINQRTFVITRQRFTPYFAGRHTEPQNKKAYWLSPAGFFV